MLLGALMLIRQIDAAPVPVAKTIPPATNNLLNVIDTMGPKQIEWSSKLLAEAKTEKETRTAEVTLSHWRNIYFRNPVTVLQCSLLDSQYTEEEQDAMRAALMRYRKRYDDAIQKKLVD